MLKIYNTLTQKKDEFIPVHDGKVGMYVCGPTVYNYIHIGNARPFIVFDVVRRYLKFKGYKVTYVQNLTDIDDKMINKAKEMGTTVKEVAERFIAEYFKDADALGIERADVHPRATEHIKEIIELIKKLEEKGYAYKIDGDVYYDISKFKEYGKLSHQKIEELQAGARIEVNDKKRNPLDFALWKAYKEGEPYWESPWGKGRPGWHIECSAMSMKYLGETLDIHAGGADLIFPHHENEIAQSEAATGKPFVKYFMHNGYLFIDKEKMSKSLGNILTVREMLQRYPKEIFRYFMLSAAHYRNPINFSDEQLQAAKGALERLYNAQTLFGEKYSKDNFRSVLNKEDEEMLANIEKFKAEFEGAMDDDFNIPLAIASLFNFVKDVNKYIEKDDLAKEPMEKIKQTFDTYLKLLGIQKEEKEEILEKDILELIEKRQKARAEKNWTEADRIRDKLLEMGIVLEDTKDGVRWKKKI